MKKIILAALALLCIQALDAQKLKTALTYNIGFPAGDFNDYVSATSFRGIGLELFSMIKPAVAVGFEGAWSLFYKKENDKVYTEGTASISGIQFRYTNMVPLLATGKYFKVTDGPATPFVGLGIGTLYIDRYTDFGLYRLTTDTWQFCLRPELGVAIKTAENAPAVLVSAKYYAGFKNDELDGQSYFAIAVGLIFR